LCILELKSKLAQQEEVSSAAVGKMRRADALATEMQKELTAERETNAPLFKESPVLKNSSRRCSYAVWI
jgi:myosin protein heavy chain